MGMSRHALRQKPEKSLDEEGLFQHFLKEFREGQGAIVETIRKKVSDAIAYVLKEDALIVTKQEDELRKHPLADLFRKLRKGESLIKKVPPKLRVFLEAYSVKPYYIPKNERFDGDEEAETLMNLAPLRAGLYPDVLHKHVFGEKFEHKQDSIEGLNEREQKFPLLRDLFIHLNPLSNEQFEKRGKRTSSRIFVIPKNYEKRGSLIISRNPKLVGGNKRTNSFYKELYSALRAQIHIIQGYRGKFELKDLKNMSELEVLELLRKEIQQMLTFLQNWKYTSSKERRGATILIGDLKFLLEKDINEYKVQTREYLESSATLRDKRKRYNPGSKAAQLVAAFNRVRSRMLEVLKIAHVVDEDAQLLNYFRERAEGLFSRMRLEFDWLLGREYFKPYAEIIAANGFIKSEAAKINGSLLKPGKKTGERKEEDKGILVPLKKLRFNNIIPAPFPQWANAALSNMRVVYKLNEQITKSGNNVNNQGDKPKDDQKDDPVNFSPAELQAVHTKVCEYAIRAQLALGYQKVQCELVRLLFKILNKPHTVKAQSIEKKIAELRRELDPHSQGAEFKRRPDIVFSEDSFTELSLYLDKVLQVTKEWQAEKLEVFQKRAEYGKKLRSNGSIEESDLEGLFEFQDALTSIEDKYLKDIYDVLKNCDFSKAIGTITVENATSTAEDIVEEICSKKAA